MKKEFMLPLGTIMGGFLLNAFAWTTTLGHPVSTICLVGGMALCVTGFIAFVLMAKKGRHNQK